MSGFKGVIEFLYFGSNASDPDLISTHAKEAGKVLCQVAELLIAKGADVDTKDEDGGMPLDATSVFNKTEAS